MPSASPPPSPPHFLPLLPHRRSHFLTVIDQRRGNNFTIVPTVRTCVRLGVLQPASRPAEPCPIPTATMIDPFPRKCFWSGADGRGRPGAPLPAVRQPTPMVRASVRLLSGRPAYRAADGDAFCVRQWQLPLWLLRNLRARLCVYTHDRNHRWPGRRRQ